MANPQTFSLRPKISLLLNVSTSGTTVTWDVRIYETESQPSFSGFPQNNTVSWNLGGCGGSVISGDATSGSRNFTYSFEPSGLQTIILASGSFTATSSCTGTASVTAGVIGSASVDEAISPSFPPPPPPPTPVWSTGTTLTAATRGTAYSRTVTASPVTSYSLVSQSGGTGTYSVSSGGVISGTPSAVGTASVTVRANNSGSTADRTFTFTVNPRTPVFTDATVGSPTIRGNAYSNGVSATEAGSYSLFSGSLPAGLSLNTSTGAITGTPTTVGTSTFVIRATNVTGSANTPSLSIVVRPRTPVFSDASVNSSARVGIAYSDAVAASETASYSVFSGGLPTGLTLNTSTGAITGTPTVPGAFTFVLRATNVTGSTNTESLTITVISAARVWNGTEFVSGLANVWNGTAFVTGTIRVWDGTTWKNTN